MGGVFVCDADLGGGVNRLETLTPFGLFARKLTCEGNIDRLTCFGVGFIVCDNSPVVLPRRSPMFHRLLLSMLGTGDYICTGVNVIRHINATTGNAGTARYDKVSC